MSAALETAAHAPGNFVAVGASPGPLFDGLLQLALEALPAEGASIALVGEDGVPRTIAASSALPTAMDEAQYRFGEGPCLEALGTGREVAAELPAGRWPLFEEHAGQARLRGVWSLPASARGRVVASLNLYFCTGRPWRERRQAGEVLAQHTGQLVAQSAALAGSELANAHLRRALEARDMIGQAKGVLMEREGLSAEEAFDVLRCVSQRGNRKLRDVAADMVAARTIAGAVAAAPLASRYEECLKMAAGH